MAAKYPARLAIVRSELIWPAAKLAPVARRDPTQATGHLEPPIFFTTFAQFDANR
jgi:hypothetical protein